MSYSSKIKDAVAKHKDLPLIREGIWRTYAEVKGRLNSNHRRNEEQEKRNDETRTAINTSHRFQSFAAERQRNTVKWHIDGHDYFWAVSEVLDAAREAIFIMDWQLSPEFYLRRPPADYPEWRLDRLLRRKAEQGVKIYVIVYKGVTKTMNASSKYTKDALEDLHPNIAVFKHPEHLGTEYSVQLWSHNEKVIIVDNQKACIGGLDACFGRWDTMNHPLADAHPADFSRTLFPGQDYNNARVLDFQQAEDYASNALSILETPRMPWHDVHMTIDGDVVLDIVQHFIERWNEIKSRKYRTDFRYDWLALPHDLEMAPNEAVGRHPYRETWDMIGRKFGNKWHEMADEGHRQDGGFGGSIRLGGGYSDEDDDNNDDDDSTRHDLCNVQVIRSVSDWSHGVFTEKSIQTAYLTLIKEANHFIYIENQFFISNTTDKGPVQNRIAQALVERILIAARANKKFKVVVVLPELPRFSGDIKQVSGIKTVLAAQWRTINRGGDSIYEQIRNAGFEPLDYIRFYHLRSYDRINASATYISQMEQGSGVTFHEAQVALARMWIGDDDIRGRSKVKIKVPELDTGSGADFGMTEKTTSKAKVPELYLPSSVDEAHQIVRRFEHGADHIKGDGEVSDNITQHLQQDTGLKDETWLGTEQEERDCYVTELVYVHSKLMIVDDRRVIMGSANINDRSQKGDGDSEIALVIEDTDMIETSMDGRPYKASRFAATLRRKLFREHLGLIPPQQCGDGTEPVTSSMRPAPYPHVDETYLLEDHVVADPLSEALQSLWQMSARTNRRAFQEIFRYVPTDIIRNWEQYKYYVPKVKVGHIATDSPLFQVKEKLATIRGSLVEASIDFLAEQEELWDGPEWAGPDPALSAFI